MNCRTISFSAGSYQQSFPMHLRRHIFFVFLLLATCVARAQEVPARPSPPRLVNDLAGVMSEDERSRLEQKLVAYDDSTSNQVVVLTVPTLNDYPIEEYALKVFRSWGIGNKTTNNGILLIAAINDHKIRIEVGYGLEGAIPDMTADAIIRTDIAPAFRSGNYYQGFDAAATSVIKAAAGEYKAPEGYHQKSSGGRGIGLGLAIVIIVILLSIFGGGGGGGGFMSRRGFRTGGFGPIIWGGILGGLGEGRGGGWSGGDSGGFGGFGGGSSGGGGASGSW